MSSKASAEPDFRALFEQAPGLYMVLDPNLRIVAASDAYLHATLTRREDIIGRCFSDVFPGTPNDPSADAMRNSLASFKRVLQTRETDTMSVQRLDVRKPESEGGGFEVRYWSPVNSPILDQDGAVACILHMTEDVTHCALAKQQSAKQTDVADGRPERPVQDEIYRTLFESMSDGFLLADLVRDDAGNPVDFRILQANRAYESVLGMTREEAVGRTLFEVFPNLARDRFGVIARVAETGEPVRWEGCFEPTGRYYRNYYYSPQPGLLAGVFSDITERKQAEDALTRARAESEKRTEEMRVLMDAVPVGVFFASDVESRHITGNPAAQELVSLPPGRNISKSAPEDERPTTWQEMKDGQPIAPEDLPMQRAVRGESVREYEMDLVFEDGTVKTVLGNASPLLDEQGKPRGGVAVLMDITDRKKAEEALREAHQKLQTTLDSITDGLLVLDRSWRYTYFSETGAKMIGMRREDLIGGCVWELFPYAKGTRFETEYHRAVETAQPVHFEEFYPDPLNKWLECHCYPSDEGLAVYFHDITERKLAEEALKAEQQHKLEFYQRTIAAATDGKLIITEPSEIEKIAGRALATLDIRSPDDTKVVRYMVEEAARSLGIEERSLGHLAVAVGEASTNVVKHAGHGEATLHKTEDSLIVVVSDHGPGIPALALPDVALTKGYSTAGTLGMGYKMMIQFADKVYLATGTEGTTVAIEMRVCTTGLAPSAQLMGRS